MDIYDELVKQKKAGISCMMITVIEKSGDGPVEIGKKMLVSERDQAFGTIGGGALEYEVRNKCKELIQEQRCVTQKYLLKEGKVADHTTTLPMACGGLVTLFYEYIGNKANITIFGAGHVGQALVNVLGTMKFNLTVIDDRPEVIESLSGADSKVCKSFTDYIEEEGLGVNAYVVVCTPSHKYDYSVLHKIMTLQLQPKYIGMICSKGKLQDYLEKTYARFGDNIDLSNFYSPMGLDTGGGSPEEIAISIAAEILTIVYDKKGHKHMRGTYGNNQLSD